MSDNEGQKDILQSLFESAVNHYSREAIIQSLDFIADLSADDIKEWTIGMAPEQVVRVYRVWEACKDKEVKVTELLPRD